MILRVDRLQPMLAAMLAIVGVMTVFSAGADWMRQLVWIAVGAAAYLAATI